MGAYNPQYTLKEETEMVCREMVDDILRSINSGDLSYQEFEGDPDKYMDHRITYGDKWYHRIIIIRVKKIFTVDHEKLEKQIRREEERHFRNQYNSSTEEAIPF